jgi:hypothetical protein
MLVLAIVVSVIIFGPKPVGPVLEEEKPLIEAWLVWNGLDSYGNPKGTMYQEGVPADRYDYIRSNHRQRPWNDIDKTWLTTFAPGENDVFLKWTEKNNFNQYGDPKDTMYLGGSPLFNEMTGKMIPLDEHALTNHPLRPWNLVEVGK